MLIRLARADDVPQLLSLMQLLAEFEDYADQFQVTEAELQQRGFGEKPEFIALVAEQDNKLVGMLVCYLIPFTFDLRPTLFIKELYVAARYRGQNAGQQLFSAARALAEEHNCGRMKWDVLHDNTRAEQFYQQQGATADSQWKGYILAL